MDVFSYGISLLEMLTREPAWGPRTIPAMIIDSVGRGQRPEIPTWLNQPRYSTLVDLMQRAWAQRPQDRPLFSDIIKALE